MPGDRFFVVVLTGLGYDVASLRKGARSCLNLTSDF
jgi:hypothetical protein